MSRYTLLFLLNLPFVVVAVISTITRYKLGSASKLKTIVHLTIWFVILIGLMFAAYLYEWLFSHGYTVSDSLSLFDVIQITAIVALIYVATRMRAKVDTLEQRLANLHREISIKLTRK